MRSLAVACGALLASCMTTPKPVDPPHPETQVPAPAFRSPDACFEGRNGVVFVRWRATPDGAFVLEGASVSDASLEPVAVCYGKELTEAASQREGSGAGRGTFRFARDGTGLDAFAALHVAAAEAPGFKAFLESKSAAVTACGDVLPRVLFDTSGRVVDVTVPGRTGDDTVVRCVIHALGDGAVDDYRGPPLEIDWPVAH